MRQNRLIPDWQRLSIKKIDEDRNSGRTTAIILKAVAKCLRKPNEWHALEDHTGGRTVSGGIKTDAQALLIVLGLKFFAFKPGFIRCNLFMEV